MKIVFDSKPHGIEIELTTAAVAKPQKIRLTKEQAAALLAVLQTAIRANSFHLEYEA